MEEMKLEESVEEALAEVVNSLESNELIIEYKQLKVKIENHEKLSELVERIKEAQKDAVKYAHYGKPEAEKEAIKKADQLTKTFDEHPLVVRYREVLFEANDLLQFIMAKIEREMNEDLTKE